MLRVRLKRPLFTAMVWQLGMVSWFFALGYTTNLIVIMAAAFVCGIGMDVMMVTWQTALQQNVPHEALSRVSSYDAFGSLLFTPLGLLIAGPLSQRIGTAQTAQVFGVVAVVVLGMIIAVRDVRDLPPLKAATDS